MIKETRELEKMLIRAGVSDEELKFWRDAKSLKEQELILLFDVLKSMTNEEIHALHLLLKKKIELGYIGGRGALQMLAGHENNIST